MSKGKNRMNKAATTTATTTTAPVTEAPVFPTPVVDVPKTEFIPHRVDPLLSFREAGRLIGRTHTTVIRWVNDNLIESVRDARGLRRIRKSELIRFTGVTAFARKSPFIWIQESELSEDYQYLESYPRVREIDSIKYFPVPIQVEQTNGQA